MGGPVAPARHRRLGAHPARLDAGAELHIPDVVAAAAAPLAVAACDGDDSYWHPRSDGTDAMAMFFEELLPLVDHQIGPVIARALMG